LNQFDTVGFTEPQLLANMQALRSFAWRFHSTRSDVDDLVQETVSKAIANSEKFQRGTKLKAWLFTIMRNTFYTKFGIGKREHVGIADDAASQVSIPANQEWTVRGRELEVAISELSKDHRTAIELVFIDCLSYEDAAVRCGCALGTIKSRVNRARLQLKAAINHD
jgi:RNA polymerase sigma-70 factor (ECF subfamily)